MKTATMFAVSLAFLIFAGTTFQLVGEMIVFQAESFFATDLFAFVAAEMDVFLPEGEIAMFLDE